jgi:hypothetical protein
MLPNNIHLISILKANTFYDSCVENTFQKIMEQSSLIFCRPVKNFYAIIGGSHKVKFSYKCKAYPRAA